MPPTRATRLQRKAAGTEASPFQSLDSAPTRARGAGRKKAPGKENEKAMPKSAAKPTVKPAAPAPRSQVEKTKEVTKVEVRVLVPEKHNSTVPVNSPSAVACNASITPSTPTPKPDITATAVTPSPKPAPTALTPQPDITRTTPAPQPDTTAAAAAVKSDAAAAAADAVNTEAATAAVSPNPDNTGSNPPATPCPIINPSEAGAHLHRPDTLRGDDASVPEVQHTPAPDKVVAPPRLQVPINVMFWDHVPGQGYRRRIFGIPQPLLHDFLSRNADSIYSYNPDSPVRAPYGAPRPKASKPPPPPASDEEDEIEVAASETAQGGASAAAKPKPRVSRLKRALDKQKEDERQRVEDERDAAERAKEKATKARAKAVAARAKAAAKARPESYDLDSLVTESLSPSPLQSPAEPTANGVIGESSHDAAATNTSRSPEPVEQSALIESSQPAQPEEPLALPQTPARSWGIGSVVTNTVGRLNPFSFFGRQTPAARAQTAPNTPILQRQTAAHADFSQSLAVVAAAAVAGAAPASTDAEMGGVLPSQEPVPADAAQQALVISSPEDAERQLLEYIARTHPSLANSKTVETLKSALNQYEIIEKGKSHRQKEAGSPSRPAQTTPDVSPVAGAKRKRKSKPVPSVIPNPVGSSYGMDLAYFSSDDSDQETESEQSEDSVAEITPPSKKQRTTPPKTGVGLAYSRELQRRIEASRERRRRRLLGHPNKPEPYFGDIFADPNQNIFNPFENFPASFAPPPKPQESGSFSVPETSSSDEDMDGEAEIIAPPKAAPSSRSGKRVVFSSEEDSSDADSRAGLNASKAGAPRSILKGSQSYSKSAQNQIANQTQNSAQNSTENSIENTAQIQAPPPAPTPTHATLPAAQTASQPDDALTLARKQANKYAPKVSSNLRESSRMTSSPIMANGIAGTESNLFAQQAAVNGIHPLTNGIHFPQSDAPTKHFATGALASLAFDPTVVRVLADLEDRLLSDPLSDIDISAEVCKILEGSS